MQGKKFLFKKLLYRASIANNNFPDITKFKGKDFDALNVDLLTYSFPCQGLSIANMGRAKGISPNSESTSNLIWQIKRILDESSNKPKYLLLENVKTLVSARHIEDYKSWNKYLESKGYQTAFLTLNGLDFGSVQGRRRVFAISIQKSAFKDLNWNNDVFKKMIHRYEKRLSLKMRKRKYMQIFDFKNEKYLWENAQSKINDTPSRRKMIRDNKELDDIKSILLKPKNKQFILNTLTTKQDRHPNMGSIKLHGKQRRFISPREAYKTMGFTNQDFNKVLSYWKKGIINKASLYRQAGNSIIVSVLKAVFKVIADLEEGNYETQY